MLIYFKICVYRYVNCKIWNLENVIRICLEMFLKLAFFTFSSIWGLKFWETLKILFFFFLDHPIMMGFEPLVNQRLLPPTFPRYAKIIKREEMVNYFARLIDRIKTVCEVVNLTNLHCILVSSNLYSRI